VLATSFSSIPHRWHNRHVNAFQCIGYVPFACVLTPKQACSIHSKVRRTDLLIHRNKWLSHSWFIICKTVIVYLPPPSVKVVGNPFDQCPKVNKVIKIKIRQYLISQNTVFRLISHIIVIPIVTGQFSISMLLLMYLCSYWFIVAK